MDEIKEHLKNEKNLKFLGQGQFGIVYKLEYQGKEYAIKKIAKSEIEGIQDEYDRNYRKKALKREIEILKKMSEYENSVGFYFFFSDSNDYIFVLEFCDKDLNQLLKEKGKFSSSEILNIMKGLNKPFKYMHNNGIIHRDIKPENIMIKYKDSSKTEYIPKIGDYGISRELEEGKAGTILGSPIYTAPEVLSIEGEGEYTDKYDLFSIGVMIYQLYFNSYPFIYPQTNKQKKQIKILYSKKEKDCEDKLLDDLINKLLICEPDKRISWDEYFKHPFFNNKGVEDLNNKINNLKINDEKEHQIIYLYDIVLEAMLDYYYYNNINFIPKTYLSIGESLKLKNEPFFILGIIGKYLEQIGISVSIEKDDLPRSDNSKDYQKNLFQIICNSYILKSKYLLDFDLGENRIKDLAKNPIERCDFNEKLKNMIMKIYNLKEEEILISNYRRVNNKFTAIIIIKSNFSKNITKDELIKVFEEDKELKTLERVDKELFMPKIKLSKSMLCPQEDNKNNQWAKGEKRGGENYSPPLGWIKYGINVEHNFNDRTNNWINHLNAKGEWSVAYCGITGITKNMEQIYENDDDIRHPGKKVGVGVYCLTDPELLEKYTETINANGENYKVGFMIRVKPDKIRATQRNQDIWVVNGNDNELRPYGILIRKPKM